MVKVLHGTINANKQPLFNIEGIHFVSSCDRSHDLALLFELQECKKAFAELTNHLLTHFILDSPERKGFVAF